MYPQPLVEKQNDNILDLTLFKSFSNLQLNNHFDKTLKYNKYS